MMKDLFNYQKEENRERCREASNAIWPFEDPPLQILLDVFVLATRTGLGGAGMCWGGGFLILCVLFWCVFTATDALHLRYPTEHVSSSWFNEAGTVKPVSSFPLLCFPEKKYYFTLIISAKVLENNTFLCGLRERLFLCFLLFSSVIWVCVTIPSAYILCQEKPWSTLQGNPESSWKRKLSTLRLKLMCFYEHWLINHWNNILRDVVNSLLLAVKGETVLVSKCMTFLNPVVLPGGGSGWT